MVCLIGSMSGFTTIVADDYLVMIALRPSNFMEPSPADALKSALAGGGAGPAWLIIGR